MNNSSWNVERVLAHLSKQLPCKAIKLKNYSRPVNIECIHFSIELFVIPPRSAPYRVKILIISSRSSKLQIAHENKIN